MFFKEFYDKELLSVQSGKQIGKVKGVFINKLTKKPKAFMVKDNKENKMYLLPLKKVAGNNDKIAVYNKRSLVEIEENLIKDLFLLSEDVIAYSHEGKALGNFTDMTLDGDRYIWFDKPYPVKFISGLENSTVTINMGLKPKDANPAMDETSKAEEKSPLPYVPKQTTVSDYSFLIGRIVIRDIIDETVGVNIKKGTVINQSVIDMAKKGGKLVYLALSSLLD